MPTSIEEEYWHGTAYDSFLHGAQWADEHPESKIRAFQGRKGMTEKLDRLKEIIDGTNSNAYLEMIYLHREDWEYIVEQINKLSEEMKTMKQAMLESIKRL